MEQQQRETNSDKTEDDNELIFEKQQEEQQAAKSADQDQENTEKMQQQQQQQQQPQPQLQQQQQQQQQQQALPSTSRLISEHQARQQQALFRALAERQKLLDELGAGQRIDLMSASCLSTSLHRPSLSKSSKSAPKRCSSNGANGEKTSTSSSSFATGTRAKDSLRSGSCSEGVPLSAVDLSSMSERMLDELLGHIASASSSSLSSNGESLDSSDLSTDGSGSSSNSELSGDEQDRGRRQFGGGSRSLRTGAYRAAQRQNDAPNVVGIHEDERIRLACTLADSSTGANHSAVPMNSRQFNCRNANRRRYNDTGDDDDDEDDDKDHELVVHVGPAGEFSDSLSPPGAREERRSAAAAAAAAAAATASAAATNTDTMDEDGNGGMISHQSSKLEHYFTTSLINPHDSFEGNELQATTANDEPAVSPSNESVEVVLSKMLVALDEIGTEHQEQLNELLERGFSHLEQLLNCSLAPNGGAAQNQNQITVPTKSNRTQTRVSQHRSHPNLALKLISNQSHNNNQQQPLGGISSTTMSKDSDYGSDTQSADCLSHNTDPAPANHGDIGQQQQQQQSQNISGTRWPLQKGSIAAAAAMTSSESPSPSSLTTTSSAQHSTSGLPPVAGSVLSPLAVELSFKLAESLHRLAQQQQQQQARMQLQLQPSPSECVAEVCLKPCAIGTTQLDAPKPLAGDVTETTINCANGSALQANPTTLTTAANGRASQTSNRKSPMKSIVMINSTRSPSVASVVSSASPSFDLSATQRNMTPVDNLPTDEQQLDAACKQQQKQQQQPRQQFKTRVNICSNSHTNTSSIALVSNSKNLQAACQTNTASDQTDSPVSSEKIIIQANKQPHRNETAEVQSEPAASVGPSSPPRSERRRPSSTDEKHSSASEPQLELQSQPVPQPRSRAASAQLAEDTMQTPDVQRLEIGTNSKSGAAVEPDTSGNERQAKRFQRALILGQKYNYSPAKLAASKLSAQLYLKEASVAASEAAAAAATTTTLKQETSKPDSGNNIAINGAQSLELNANGHQEFQNTKALSNGYHKRPVRVTGQVQLDISYLAKSGSLTVHLLQCTQLAAVSKRYTTSNPYVKLYLLPDKSKAGKRKSSVHRNQLNPNFNEKFTFGPLQLAEFDQKVLWLSVWHRDRLGRNESLGDLLLPLNHVRNQLLASDLCQSTAAQWYQLRERCDLKQTLYKADGRRTTLVESEFAKVDSKRKLQAKGKLQQAEIAAKLSEFQRKADRLTSGVAPSRGLQMIEPTLTVAPKTVANYGNQREFTSQSPITGQLFVALKFVPESSVTGRTLGRPSGRLEGELHVMIKEAHNIAGFELPPLGAALGASAQLGANNQIKFPPLPSGSLPNPFCKCYLLATTGQRVAKLKTPHLKRTANPRWDHNCVFAGPIKLSNLTNQALEILLYNRDSILVSNEFLGGVRLCSKPNGNGNENGSVEQQLSPLGGQQTIDCNDLASSKGNTLEDTSFSLRRNSSQQDSTKSHNGSNIQIDTNDELCNEHEARLWSRMLARPNIWVYGELHLRPLRPLMVNKTAGT